MQEPSAAANHRHPDPAPPRPTRQTPSAGRPEGNAPMTPAQAVLPWDASRLMLMRVDHGLEHAIESTRAAPASRRDAGPDPATLSSALGNRNFTQLVARMHDGEGILSGGVVHPDVEAAIAAAHGSGAPLESA